MVKLTQVNKIQIYIFSSFGSIKKNLKSWNNDIYISSFKIRISSSILLRESFFGDQFTAARGRPVMPGSYPFYPPHGENSKDSPHSSIHRCPFILLSSSRAQSIPIGDFKFHSRKRRSLCGICILSPAWPTSQAGPSISSSKSHSKGTLWLVSHRSTFLGHRFKIALVEHPLLHPRTCS